MDENGFTLVGKSKKRRNRASNHLHYSDVAIDVHDNISSLESIRGQVKNDGVFRALICAHEKEPISNVVSYGLGSFTKDTVAAHQAAVLLEFTDRHLTTDGNPQLLAYDPVFSEDEKKVLSGAGFTVPQENDACFYSIHECKTLFFMPHCGRSMYCNVLAANWNPESLANLVILGNSLSQISDRVKDDPILAKLCPFLVKITEVEGLLQERKLPHFQLCDRAFNDTSLHFFCISSCLRSCADFWNFPDDYDPKSFSFEIRYD